MVETAECSDGGRVALQVAGEDHIGSSGWNIQHRDVPLRGTFRGAHSFIIQYR